jgi:hypothetical protein
MTVSPLPTARDHGVRRVGCWLFILALTAYLVTAGGSMTITDAVVMFDVTQNVVERHTVAMSSSLLGMDLRVLPRAAVFVLILTFIAWVSFCARQLRGAMSVIYRRMWVREDRRREEREKYLSPCL